MAADRNEIADLFGQLYEGLTKGTVNPEETRRELEEQGINVEAAITKGVKLIADFKRRRRLQLARKRFDRLHEAVQSWAGVASQSIDRMKEDIAQAFAGEAGEAAYNMYYRKLSRIGRADLESLKEDAALLELIEKIEVEDTK